MAVSRNTILRLLIALMASVTAAVLLFGPIWVKPIDPSTGLPFPGDLPAYAPQRALAVFVLCLGLWISHVIPLAATSLLAVGLLPLLNVMPHTEAFAYFGNTAVFFILGVFILASAMIDTGLSKRLTLRFLHRFDRSPRRLIGGVLVCGAFFSLWMPEHAVAAMMYPLVVEIAEALRLKRPGSVYARSLFLALAWGTVVGGVGTYLGGARAVLAVELYTRFYPDAVMPSFLSFAAKTLPIVVIMTFLGYWVITLGARPDVDSIARATRMVADRVRELGPMRGRERRLAVLMIATILAWVVGPWLSQRLLGYPIELGAIAIVGGVMVFVLRISQWNRVQDYVNWGVVMMYGGAVALGYAVADTHAMHWVAAQVVPLLGPHPFLLLVFLAAAAMIMTEGISNAAVVTVLLPVGFAMCGELGLRPLAVMYAVAISSGLAYSLPMSSPPNAIAFSSGYYGIGTVIRRGILMNIVSLILFVLVAWFYWPLVGVSFR